MRHAWLIVFSLLLVARASADEQPIICPAATVWKTMPGLDGETIEVCEDPSTHARYGPGRFRDGQNRLLFEIQYEKGHEVSRRYTDVGVARQVDLANAAMRLAGMPLSYEIVDAKTLRYVVTMDLPADVPLEGAFDSGEQPCELLRLPGARFETLEMIVRGTDGKELRRKRFARGDCERRRATAQESG